MGVKVSRLSLKQPLTAIEREAAIAWMLGRAEGGDGGCLVWKGMRNKAGYGQAMFQKQPWMAHRLMWVLARGPIPVDIFVCHHCDNPSCINLDHLFLGTHTDNQRDMAAKKRHFASKKTHCKRGHPLSGDNLWTYTHADGTHRVCKQCANERQLRRWHTDPEFRQRFYEKRKAKKLAQAG